MSPLGEKQLDFACFQIEKLLTVVQLADSKAQFILGANTFLISVTVALFLEQICRVFQHQGEAIVLAYAGLLIAFVAATLVSMIQASLVVLPRDVPFSQDKPHAPLLYYEEISRVYKGAKEYSDALPHASLQEMLANAGAEVYSMSITASSKYNLLRLSLKWLLASMALWILLLSGTLLFQP